MRELEQIQADLRVVIHESILGDLRQPEAGRMVDALRAERFEVQRVTGRRPDLTRVPGFRRDLADIRRDLGI